MAPIVQRRSWGYEREVDAAGIPWTIDAPYFMIFHDRDVAMDITSIDRLLTELGKEVRYNLPTRACLPRAINGRTYALHASLSVHKRTIRLRKAGYRKQNLRGVGSRVVVRVDYNQKLDLLR